VSTFVLFALLGGYILFCILMIVPLWRVYGRTGLNPALSILFAVPVAGPLVVLLLLAFNDWPAAPGGPS
jgi:hypothetical protein